jgi:hypothetical protein
MVDSVSNKANSYGVVTYTNLRKIRAGLTYSEISTLGSDYAKANPVYRYIPIVGLPGNNCKTFAKALWGLLR